MELPVCVGTVCQMMVLLGYGKNQADLIGEYVSCIDAKNTIRIFPKPDEADDGIKYDSSAASRILSGDQLLALTSEDVIKNVDIQEAAELFDKKMESFIPPKNRPLLMLSLLEMIKNDGYINGHFREIFGDYFCNNSYYYPEFMIRILLYSVDNRIPTKRKEKKLVKEIKNNINETEGGLNVYDLLLEEVKKKYPKELDSWNSQAQYLKIRKSKLPIDSSAKKRKTKSDKGAARIDSNNNVQAALSVPPKYKKCHFCKGYVPCGAMKGKCKYNGDKAVEAENNSCEFFDEDRNTVIEYIRSKGVF